MATHLRRHILVPERVQKLVALVPPADTDRRKQFLGGGRGGIRM